MPGDGRREIVDAFAAQRREEQDRDLPVVARRSARPSTASASLRACSAGAPRSLLVTTTTCGISTMPAFMNCRLSPEPG